MILLTLISKNFKQLLRSKTSALIILIGPLLLIALLGLAFNNVNEYALNIGVFSQNYSEVTNSYISSIQSDNYRLSYFDTESECINAVKDASVHTCIIFPENLKINSQTKPEINFYVDSTNEMIVHSVISTISSKFNAKTKEFSQGLVSDVMTVINSVDTDSKDLQTIISNSQNDTDYSLTQTSKIITDSNSINLDSDLSDVNGLSDIANVNDLRYGDMKSTTTHQFSTLKSALSDIKDIYPGLNSSLKNDFDSIIDNLNEQINNTKKVLDSNNSNYTYISQRINNLVINIDSLSSKLDNVKETKTQIKEKSELIKTKLNLVSTNLNLASNKINNIRNNIQSLSVTSPDLLTSPFDIRVNYEKPNHFQSMFSGMIIILVMFVSLLLSTHMIIKERESPAYFRNVISPMNPFIYIMSMYITNLIITSIQTSIILLVAIYYFKLQFALPYLILMLFITTTLFSFIGLIIGHIFSSEETSTMAAVSLSAIFMFLSDLIIPIESIPRSILKYVKFNPIYRFKTIINLFDNNNPLIIFKALENEFIIYIIVLFVLLLITLIISAYSRKNIFGIFAMKKHKKLLHIKKDQKH